jgi:signal transduction histidine kinase
MSNAPAASSSLPGRLGRGLLIAGAFTVFGFGELFDVITSCVDQTCAAGRPVTGPALVPVIAGGLVVVLAAVAVRRRSGPAVTVALALAAAGVVLAVSVGLFALAGHARPEPRISVAEIAAALLLTGLTAYRCRAGVALAVAASTAVALSTGGLRVHSLGFGDVRQAVFVIVWPVAAGWYLRSRTRDQAWRVEAARQQERLALARDLHDVVAHHVTGMVVQAQALQHVAQGNLSAVPPALGDIEQAGVSALAAMQRMVGAMRESPDAVRRRPVELRADLEKLVAEGGGGLPVHLDVDGEDSVVPPEIASSMLRVAQEAVTNARRYAREATRIDITVHVGADRLTLTVRDDGRPGAVAAFLQGGGYGLAGMRERVALLAGTFDAGPGPDGWHVRAVIPLPARTTGPGQ